MSIEDILSPLAFILVTILGIGGCVRIHNNLTTDGCAYPVSLLSLLDTHHGVVPVLLREPTHQTYKLLIFLTIQLQLLPVPAAVWGRSRHNSWISQSACSIALLQPLAVAFHDVGDDAVGPVALPRVHLSALGARAGSPLPLAPGAGPVASDASLAESVVTGQRDRLLE